MKIGGTATVGAKEVCTQLDLPITNPGYNELPDITTKTLECTPIYSIVNKN